MENWFPAIFPFLFVGFWILICHLLSAIGGWKAIAQSYPAQSDSVGEEYWWRSGRLGWVNYSSCLNFVVGPGGLRVATSLPFRVGHTPFFVPWTDIRAEAETRFFFDVVRLTFKQAPHATLEVPARLARTWTDPSLGAFAIRQG